MKNVMLLLTCLFCVACTTTPTQEQSTASVELETLDTIDENLELTVAQGLGIKLSSIDRSVRPQDDFFRHVNGNWLKYIQIPADQSNYGSFTQLADESQEIQKEIISSLARAKHPHDTNKGRIGNYYRAFMDERAVNAFGIKPIRPALAEIAQISSYQDLLRYFGLMQKMGLSGPMQISVGQDVNDTSRYAAYLRQSGLALPDRNYYISDAERFVGIRKEYLDHLEQMFRLARFDDAANRAKRVLDLETAIARIQWDRVRNRDRNATNNPTSVQDLIGIFGELGLRSFLNESEVGKEQQVNVRQPDFIQNLSSLILQYQIDAWRDYLRWKLIRQYAPYLTTEFVEADFEFFGKMLRGTHEIRPRWKRAVSAVNNALGEAVGEIYVAREFSPESKVRMDQMVENLRKAFEQSINDLEWMSQKTKEQAQLKLSKFTPKIGYPKKWKSYDDLLVSERDLVANVMASAALEYERMVSKLGNAVDHEEWFMTPQTVNAYYNPSMNEIVFPAAILQPPFFNVDADDAVNYGAIGAVIGHEFSHGFDDQGRKSDGNGNLRDWWTEEDAAEFKRRANGLVEQYNQFSPLEGEFVNGELTLGENIGDLAGLTMAYRAYKLSLKGEPAPVIAGYTGDQRFFMGWAQVWQRVYRDDELRRRLLTDPHSPSEYRVNGIVANMPEFQKTFDVRPGDKLYRAEDEMVKIW